MQRGLCPRSRNKPICFYKALIRILFSQSPAHTGGPGAVYRACTVGLKASVCAFKTFGVNIKCLGGFLEQTSEGWLKRFQASIVIYTALRLSSGEVMVPGSCLDSGGQSICYSLEQKLLCLHWNLMERSLNQGTVTARHIKLQERNAARPFHMHTQLYGVDSGGLDGKPDL